MLSISIFMILSEHFWETRGEAKTAEIGIAFKTFIFLLFFLSRSIKNLLSFVQWKSYFPLFKYIYLNNWWNYGQLLFYRGSWGGARELFKSDREWWNYLRIEKKESLEWPLGTCSRASPPLMRLERIWWITKARDYELRI